MSLEEVQRWRRSRTELMRAAGDLQAVSYVRELLSHGVDPHARDIYGVTALMEAALAGVPDSVSALLDAGADTRACDNDGWTAMDCAVYGTRDAEGATVRLLQAAGLNAAAAWRGSAFRAVTYDDASRLSEIMVDHSEMVHCRFRGDPIVLHAADKGARAATQFLLARGSDPNARGRRALPLAAAARGGHLEICKLLIEAGADIWACEIPTNRQTTARAYAVQASYGRLERQLAVAAYLEEEERRSRKGSPFARATGIDNSEIEGHFILVRADADAVGRSMALIAGLDRQHRRILGRLFPVGGRSYLLLQFKGHQWTSVYPMTLATIGDPWSEYAKRLSAELGTASIEYQNDLDEGSFCVRYYAGKEAERSSAVGNPAANNRVLNSAQKMLRAEKAYLHGIEPCRWSSGSEMQFLPSGFTMRDVEACDWMSTDMIPEGRITIPATG